MTGRPLTRDDGTFGSRATNRFAIAEAGASTCVEPRAMGGDSASTHVVLATLEGFWQPEHRDLLAPWVVRAAGAR